MIEVREVQGYHIALDRHYDPDRHLWVQVVSPGVVRVGMDPLGVETSGDLVQLAMAPTGSRLVRGEAFGSIEAAKFVGPLESPVAGVVRETNAAAVADPGLVMDDPMGAGWLIVVELDTDWPDALDGLVSGDEVVTWFEGKVAEYRLKGMIAE